jgi:hypothetical protein
MASNALLSSSEREAVRRRGLNWTSSPAHTERGGPGGGVAGSSAPGIPRDGIAEWLVEAGAVLRDREPLRQPEQG